MPFIFENLYSDHSTVGFRFCKNGNISDSYKEHQIRIQDKQFLKKTTIDQMTKKSETTEDNTIKTEMGKTEKDKGTKQKQKKQKAKEASN